MAVLFSYPIKSTLVPEDLVLISDSEDSNKTKNTSVSAIKDAIDVVDSIVAGNGISVSSPTGNVTISTIAYSGGSNIGHVPSGGTSSDFLRGDGTWSSASYSLPLAADGTRGGVQIGYGENGQKYPVELSSEKMFVNVPWQNTTDISLTTTGTSGAAQWNGTTLNIPQYAGTDTTYSLSASQSGANDVKLALDASAGTDSSVIVTSSDNTVSVSMFNGKIDLKGGGGGSAGVSSFTNSNGTYISAGTENSAATGNVSVGTIDLSAVNGNATATTKFLSKDNTWSVPRAPIEGFNTYSIYSASFKAGLVESGTDKTVIRQTVCETECEIGYVDFFRFSGTAPVSIFVYRGVINDTNGFASGDLILQGSQANPSTAGTTAPAKQNTINTIEFVDNNLTKTTAKIDAGTPLVIVFSISGSEPGLFAGDKHINDLNIARLNDQFMVPLGFDSPNPPDTELQNFLDETQAEQQTIDGFALHFYNIE